MFEIRYIYDDSIAATSHGEEHAELIVDALNAFANNKVAYYIQPGLNK